MTNKLRYLLITGTTLAVTSFSSSIQAGNPQSYPMVCKGGGDSILHISPHSSGKTKIDFQFKKNPRAATGGLSNGSCAWLDRAISRDEPDRLQMIFNGITVGTKLQRKNVITPGTKQKSQSKSGPLQYIGSSYSGNTSEIQLFKNVFNAFNNGTEFQIHAYLKSGVTRRTSSGRRVRTRATFVATKVGP